MKQIGIDLGSSYIKFAVFDMDERRILYKDKQSSVPALTSENGKYEIPATAIVKQVVEIIDRVSALYDDVEGVVFSTQMHGFVFCPDGETSPVYVSWQDQRSQNPGPGEERSWLSFIKEEFPEDLMKQTGVHIKTALSLCNMLIMVREQYGKCPSGEFYTLGSYVISHLTGNNCCHITNAAPSGMVDIHQNVWNMDVIRKAGFENVRFPKILTGFENCGVYEANGRTIRVYADYGDQQATILGCSPDINDIVVNIGTAAQICQVVDGIIPNGYEVRPFFEGTFLNTISNLPGGRNIEYYLDFLADVEKTFFNREPDRADLWKVLDGNNSWESKGLTMETNFFSMKDGSIASGSIGNITPGNFRSTALTAAAYEGIARDYLSSYRHLTRETVKPSRILLAGGKLSRQSMMVRTLSRFFDIPVISAPESDTVFDGLFKILQVCCGIAGSLSGTAGLISD